MSESTGIFSSEPSFMVGERNRTVGDVPVGVGSDLIDGIESKNYFRSRSQKSESDHRKFEATDWTPFYLMGALLVGIAIGQSLNK